MVCETIRYQELVDHEDKIKEGLSLKQSAEDELKEIEKRNHVVVENHFESLIEKKDVEKQIPHDEMETKHESDTNPVEDVASQNSNQSNDAWEKVSYTDLNLGGMSDPYAKKMKNITAQYKQVS